jgi:hypothetical protein
MRSLRTKGSEPGYNDQCAFALAHRAATISEDVLCERCALVIGRTRLKHCGMFWKRLRPRRRPARQSLDAHPRAAQALKPTVVVGKVHGREKNSDHVPVRTDTAFWDIRRQIGARVAAKSS